MLVSFMPMARFELARAYTHCDLNTARLPIPPQLRNTVIIPSSALAVNKKMKKIIKTLDFAFS